MGGKKKAGGAKKGKGGDDDEFDPALMNTILKAEVDCLKQKLVLEQEKMDRSAAKEEEIRQDQVTLDEEMEQHRKFTAEIVASMTKSYREMENMFQDQIAEKETQVAEQETQKRDLNAKIKELKEKREIELREKDQEIHQLKEKIDEMSCEFARMLKDTLTKMQDRIDLANQWEGDALTDGGPATGIQRMD